MLLYAIIVGVLLLYRALAALALTAYAPYAFLRSLTGRRRLGDVRGRLGLSDWPDLGGGVWIHAVSVGEIGVARNLLPELRRRHAGRPLRRLRFDRGGPRARRALARPRGRRVYAFPFDLAGPVEKALSETRPGLIVLTETEIWPLFIERAARRGIPVALVNGRISERSFGRYRLVGRFLAKTLARLSIAAMQSKEDARRLEALGAPRGRVKCFGNLKYDLAPPPAFADADRLSAAAAGRPILVAGSTGEGEESLVLDAWQASPPPRRSSSSRPAAPNASTRSPGWSNRAACAFCAAPLSAARRSTLDALPDVYLLDSIGELASVYRGAALAFAGGSLVPSGGQSPIEAWAAGVARRRRTAHGELPRSRGSGARPSASWTGPRILGPRRLFAESPSPVRDETARARRRGRPLRRREPGRGRGDGRRAGRPCAGARGRRTA